jgi:hypothetical protein
MVTFLLSRCRERTCRDWVLAGSLDLLTVAWVGVLVAWWV